MWNSFGKILKKEKNQFKKIKQDKYLVLKTSERVFEKMFSEKVLFFIKCCDFQKEKLFLEIKKSVWRNEIKLKTTLIKKRINKEFKKEVVREIIIKQ